MWRDPNSAIIESFSPEGGCCIAWSWRPCIVLMRPGLYNSWTIRIRVSAIRRMVNTIPQLHWFDPSHKLKKKNKIIAKHTIVQYQNQP